MKVVTYNIHYGFGRDGTADLDRIAATVEAADVVALQEVERFWPRSGMVDQVAVLAKRLPDHWVAYGPTIDLHSPAAFPGEIDAARRQFGNAIFSRRPILSSANVLLPRPVGDAQTMQRGALEVVIDSTLGPLRVYSTHLDYRSSQTRLAQLRAIAARHHNAARGGGAWEGLHPIADEWVVGDEPKRTSAAILLGDMNIATGSSEYRAALGLLPDFVDPSMDAGAAGATKDRLRIDHTWTTRDVAARFTAGWVDREAAGSDHLPAWIEVDL